ncbi:MAG TPA: hypothetical protein VKS20_03600 [Candidatus Acidoferrales bacterium]|nr:hypothetical protein [Candidatus Acidoferrales bacterium]
MRIVPPDEYNGAIAFLQKHGHSVKPSDSFSSGDPLGARTEVDGKSMSAEEVVKLAVEKGWILP